jgi:hypothetical protein
MDEADQALRDLIEGNWAPVGEARPMIEYRPTRRLIMSGLPAQRFLLDHYEEVSNCTLIRAMTEFSYVTMGVPTTLVEAELWFADGPIVMSVWECYLLDYVLGHIENVGRVDWDSNMLGAKAACVTLVVKDSTALRLYANAELVPMEEGE